MTKVNIGGIRVNNMRNCAGVMWGDKNNHQQYRHTSTVNEVFGNQSGNMNILFNNKFLKNNKW